MQRTILQTMTTMIFFHNLLVQTGGRLRCEPWVGSKEVMIWKFGKIFPDMKGNTKQAQKAEYGVWIE